MKRRIFVFNCFFHLMFCITSAHSQITNQSLDNVLLQESKEWPRYIYLLNDKVFYERYQFDKRSYFTDFDTLVLDNGSNYYRGKNISLYLDNKTMRVVYAAGRDSGRNLFFNIASNKEKQKWNNYKNKEKYYVNWPKLTTLLEANKSNCDLYHQIKDDCQKLQKLLSSLTQAEFDLELDRFKSKYSIR